MGQLGEHIRRRRRNDDDIALLPEGDVSDVGFHTRCPQVGEDRPMGDCLKRQRLQKSLRVGSHGYVDDRASLMERARQSDRLVRGDAARNAQGYVLFMQDPDPT